MNRPITTLFMLESLDGKISSGSSDNLDVDKDFSNPYSFASFIDYSLRLLHDYKNSVLRLHAGENSRSKPNPLATLEIIDKAVNGKYTVPEPFIRMGHAVFFEKDKEERYLTLLGKYHVVVEINASSNVALSSVSTVDEVPYKWYQERNIPFVISTDGGGTHLTDPIQEAKLAMSNGEKVIEHVEKSETLIRR